MVAANCSEITGFECSYHALESDPEQLHRDMMDHILNLHGPWYESLSESEKAGIMVGVTMSAR